MSSVWFSPGWDAMVPKDFAQYVRRAVEQSFRIVRARSFMECHVLHWRPRVLIALLPQG
jgi:hypothetical protein